IGLVYRAISAREDAYRRLAELLTRLVSAVHPVTADAA
ncbi:hydrogen peroxide-inducible genes activator, partial [Mycobacteroides abscessus]